MPTRLLTLIRKEFTALLRDPRSRYVLIAPPIMQLVIFAFAATLEVKNNSVTIFSEDGGAAAVELVSRLSRNAAFSEVRHVFDRAALGRDIETQASLVAVHIPQDFSARIARGESAPVQVIVDGRRSNSGQIALGYVSRMVADLSAELAGAGGAQARTEIEVRHWYNPNLVYLWFNIPGLLMILTALITMVVTALSVARERELGTFDQLLVSPYSPAEILLGKAIPAYLVALAEGMLIFTVGVFLYGVPFEGSPLLLFCALSVYLVSLVGVGLFISSLCQTQQQAILGVFCFVLPAILLSGFASPVDNMPRWLQILDLANPLRHFFVISKGVFLKDISFATAWHSLWPILIIGCFTLYAANWLFRHKIG